MLKEKAQIGYTNKIEIPMLLVHCEREEEAIGLQSKYGKDLMCANGDLVKQKLGDLLQELSKEREE